MVVTKMAVATLSFLFSQDYFREESLALAKRLKGRMLSSRIEIGMTLKEADKIMGMRSFPHAGTLRWRIYFYKDTGVSLMCKRDFDAVPGAYQVSQIYLEPVLQSWQLRRACRWINRR